MQILVRCVHRNPVRADVAKKSDGFQGRAHDGAVSTIIPSRWTLWFARGDVEGREVCSLLVVSVFTPAVMEALSRTDPPRIKSSDRTSQGSSGITPGHPPGAILNRPEQPNSACET
jgi:hypothetical protein